MTGASVSFYPATVVLRDTSAASLCAEVFRDADMARIACEDLVRDGYIVTEPQIDSAAVLTLAKADPGEWLAALWFRGDVRSTKAAALDAGRETFAPDCEVVIMQMTASPPSLVAVSEVLQ